MTHACSKCQRRFERKPWEVARNTHVCRPCRAAYERTRRKNVRERMTPDEKHEARLKKRAYDKVHHSIPEVRARDRATSKAYRHTPQFRKYAREASRKRAADPNAHAQQKARRALNYAVSSGKLTRQPCSRCGAGYACGHHDDYAAPLRVVWLCYVCHKALHMEEAARKENPDAL